MRPSVISATLWPLLCSELSVGVSWCSSGMPLARGPWKRTTTTQSRDSAPDLYAAMTDFLIVEYRGRRFDDAVLRLDGGSLDDGAPEIAAQDFQAAVGAERIVHRTQHVEIAARFGRCAPREHAVRRATARCAYAPRPLPITVVVSRAAARSRAARESGSPCRRPRGSDSRRRRRSGRCAPAAARFPTDREKSSQSTRMPAARAIATRCSV